MKKTEKIKLQIIENWIENFTSDEAERRQMRMHAKLYMKDERDGGYNEILGNLDIKEDKLGIHCTCQNCGSSTNL